MTDDLERVLQLAQNERKIRNSKSWKGVSFESTLDAHTEAVENLYAELYRLLDVRNASGTLVERFRTPPDPRKQIKAQIIKRLRDELPSIIASIIDEF